MATRFELAHQAWPILVALARRRRTTTYEDFARALGYRSGRVARYPLWPIQDFCMERGLPPLTSIVLNKNTGLPGGGFVAWEGEIREAHMRVFGFPWQRLPKPFPPGTLLTPRKGHRPGAKRGRQRKPMRYVVPDREVLVNGRGPYQARFRAHLMRIYRHRCALCDTRANELLVASHIIPWATDTTQRLNPRNGLLLCRAHDALFEEGLILIQDDLRVEIPSTRTPLGSDAERFLRELTASRVRCPSKTHAPDPRFLRWRADRIKSHAGHGVE